MTEEDTIGPLKAAQQRIDDAITAYRDKIAALLKRREYLQGAIDVIRCGDDEIMALPVIAHRAQSKNRRPKVGNFDEEAVETRLVGLLTNNKLSFPQIQLKLEEEGFVFSVAGLKRIVNTCPQVIRTGVRNSTCYEVKASVSTGK